MGTNTNLQSTRALTKHEFQQLFKEYYNPLCNYCNQLLGGSELVEDIVQGVFLNMWNNQGSLNPQYTWKNYLYKSVKNRALDELRHRKVKQKHRSYALAMSEAEEHEEFLDPILIKEQILKATEKLKPKNRTIFLLSKFEGLTYEEIAAHLHISKRAVEDNIARALRILRNDLASLKEEMGYK